MSRFIRYINEPAAEAIYKEVVSKIPSVEEKELRTELSNDIQYATLCMTDLNAYQKKEQFVRDPKIYVGPKFFELSEDKQIAAIGHEIGHYKHEKGITDDELEQYMANKTALRLHLEQEKLLPTEEVEKFIQEIILNETRADNCTAEIGYGQPLLEFLTERYRIKLFGMYISPSPGLEAEIRIKKARMQNLKERLEFYSKAQKPCRDKV